MKILKPKIIFLLSHCSTKRSFIDTQLDLFKPNWPNGRISSLILRGDKRSFISYEFFDFDICYSKDRSKQGYGTKLYIAEMQILL